MILKQKACKLYCPCVIIGTDAICQIEDNTYIGITLCESMSED